MFYAQFVLSKKGPLARIWLAAHWEKKLSKAQIYETNVQDAVDEILKPKVKMALRTTGHLLLGIVRIYSRKAKYLLADCNEAFLKIKMAFRPGQVAIEDDGHQAVSTAINLPEVFHDFDAALPDFNEFDMQSQFHINQSRIDDITLKEDLIPETADMPFGAEFGADDFGENSLGLFADEHLEEARQQLSSAFERLERTDNPSSLTVLEDTGGPKSGGMPADEKQMLIGLSDQLNVPDPDDDFVDFGAENMLDEVLFNENELTKSIDAMEAPGAEAEIPVSTEDNAVVELAGAVSTAPGQMTTESFALEPLDAAAVAIVGIEKPSRAKRRKRLVVDEQKSITGEEMKANMANYRDTMQPLDLAPPTKKLMQLKEAGTADKLFSNPGCHCLHAETLLKLYQLHLILRARDADTMTNDQVRRDLEMVDNVDENIEPEGSVASEPVDDRMDDFDEVGEAMSPMFGALPLDTIPEDGTLEEDQMANKDFGSPERKKERRSKPERIEDEDMTAEGEDDHKWTKRTQNVLNSISAKIKASADGKILLSHILTKGATRKTAAQKFYTLLVLKKWQAIDVHQSEPFGDIEITAGPNITSAVTA